MKRILAYTVFVLVCLTGGTFVAVGCSSLAGIWSSPVTVDEPPADLPPPAEGKVWANVSGVWVEVEEAALSQGTRVVELPNGVRFAIAPGEGEQTTGGLLSNLLGGILATVTGNPMLAPIIGGAIKRAGDGLAGVTLARRREEDPPTTPVAPT